MAYKNYKLKLYKLPILENYPFIEETFDAITLYQVVSKIGKELLDTMKQVIENTNYIDNIDLDFTEINQKISNLQYKINQLETTISNLEAKIDIKVNNELQNQYNQIVQLMNDYQSIFNNNLNNLRTDLEDEIEQLELGNVKAYNPTTGEIENISKVIQDVYDSLRQNSITVTEFENLDLTATEFDDKEISAYNFDINGKTFLNV